MVSIFSLWLPILLSGVMVFILSSIIHMVLGYHRNDFKGLPDEAGAEPTSGEAAEPLGHAQLAARGTEVPAKVVHRGQRLGPASRCRESGPGRRPSCCRSARARHARCCRGRQTHLEI